ncbi:MAG TPA: HlyD family efflux transporter periplasmic adaptor subunit [Anaerolineae bacterium]|nr:HlyD family efflux transporter periplasmic adaptor subunit [Anaerolineae bacterium]HIP73455.1 HlyD family efflux transporter periplasmic adaptor subunit [Anaerolineae bacterium]
MKYHPQITQITQIFGKKAVFLLAAAAFLLAACQSEGGVDTAVSAKPNAVSKPAAQAGIDVVSAEGVVEPLFYVGLAFQTGGEVAEILVEEGDQVQAGDVLIKLDAADLEIALQQAEARLASAQAGLVAAQKQLELAQSGVQTAQGAIEAAEANLALTKAGPQPEEIAAAEANLAAAEAAVQQAASQRNASLDVTSEADIFEAEANVAQAMAQVRALEEGYENILDACFELPDGSEVCPLYGPVEESTRQQLEVARQNLAAAQAALDALRQGPTGAQRQAAQGGVAFAIANRDAAQTQLDLLLAGVTPEQIAVAEAGVVKARAGLAIAKAEVTKAEAAVEQAEAAVQQAEVNVASANTALERTVLQARFAGEVSRIHTSVGQLAQPGMAVVTVADFSEWLVQTTDLTELDVPLVGIGASVEVELDALPNEKLTGTVTAVSLTPSLSRGDVVYKTTIQLDNPDDLPIRWGMTAFVDIEANN